MTSFVLAAAVLTLIVAAMLGLPLLRPPRSPGVDRAALNARLLREELAALEAEHARGTLDAQAFARQRDELTRRVLEDVGGAAPSRALARHALPTLGGLLLVLPLSGALLYLLLGSPGALAVAGSTGSAGPATTAATTAAVQPTAGAATPPKQIQDMVSKLAARLNAHPDDPKGWAMLGRSYSVLGRFGDAVAAYARIGPTLQTNASWLAEYADALAMQAGGNPVGRPDTLARAALRIDPDNLLALMLAGYASTQRGDDQAALPLLRRAAREVAPGSDDAAFVDNLLQHAQARLGGSAAGLAPAAASTRQALPPSSAPAGAAAPTVLTAHLSLAPALRAQAAGRTLYVIARKPGETMPVAVLKRSSPGFPLDVGLSDADSMIPSQPLSKAGPVLIEARLSASGDAMPASGDDYGVSPPVSSGRVDLSIDRRRP
ncbi:MAG: c-type cytochrome biogenesis protein CcmI [Betaproteobacteria bacterium]|nr:c-type cytochrome biogenesis protein CcmI [Betaproteobacteria bacterium]